MPPVLSWVVPRAFGLQMRVWGEECVVYNQTTAETHLLSQTAGSALSFLCAGSKTLDEVVNHLAADFLLEDRDAVAEYTQDTLGQFERLGLVHVAAPSAG